jgi:hypothetical protein
MGRTDLGLRVRESAAPKRPRGRPPKQRKTAGTQLSKLCLDFVGHQT